MKLVSDMPLGPSYRVTVWLHGTKQGKRKRQWQSAEVGYVDTPQPVESLRDAIIVAIDRDFRSGWNPLVKVKQEYVSREPDGICYWEPFNPSNTSEAYNVIAPGATSEATV